MAYAETMTPTEGATQDAKRAGVPFTPVRFFPELLSLRPNGEREPTRCAFMVVRVNGEWLRMCEPVRAMLNSTIDM